MNIIITEINFNSIGKDRVLINLLNGGRGDCNIPGIFLKYVDFYEPFVHLYLLSNVDSFIPYNLSFFASWVGANQFSRAHSQFVIPTNTFAVMFTENIRPALIR